MSDAWAKKILVKVFRLSCRLAGPVEKGKLIHQSETQSKNVKSKNLFFDRVRKPDMGFSLKRHFSTDNSTPTV